MTKKYALGIDLGGTFVKYAIIADDATIICKGKSPTESNKESLIQQLKNIVGECIRTADEKGIRLDGIGIGTPGIISPDNKTLLGGAPNITGWENVPLAGDIESAHGIVTRLCNDANAIGLAEYMFGAAKGFSDVVFVGVGTGIGGAVIINNRMMTGFQNRGAELGCIPFIADGIECNCGANGCWEAYASTAAMLRFYAERSGEEIDGKELIERYLDGEDLAKEILEQECFYLGRGIAGLINIFAPQRVVIGGGISESGQFFIDMVAKYAFENAIHDCAVNTEIHSAKLGNKAGMIGAACMMFGK